MKYNTKMIWVMPLVLAAATVVVSAQKSGSGSSNSRPKQTRQASSQNYPSHQPQQRYQQNHDPYIAEQQQQVQQPYSNNRGYAQPFSAEKPLFAQIIQDQRQLNHDGTINYAIAADNGLQQGETVDPDGTRRGFYSYIGADGKPITVKYTAGKDGFRAEGDHLPRQPEVPSHKDGDELLYLNGNGGQNQGSGQVFNQPRPQSQQQYRPQQQQARPQYRQQQAPSYSPKGFGHPTNTILALNNNNNNNNNGFSGFQDFGPVNYGAPSNRAALRHAAPAAHFASPQTQYPTHAVPVPSRSISSGGNAFTALNPYQQDGPAGPYNAQFDLGNGGQYSIDFTPGPVEIQNQSRF